MPRIFIGDGQRKRGVGVARFVTCTVQSFTGYLARYLLKCKVNFSMLIKLHCC